MSANINITVNGKVLADLLASQPEVRLELLSNATAQVAEQLKHKIEQGGLAQKIYADLEADVRKRMGHRYNFPKEVVDEINKSVADAVRKAVGSTVLEELKMAVARAMDQAQVLVAQQVAGVIEKKFVDMVQSAARLKR